MNIWKGIGIGLVSDWDSIGIESPPSANNDNDKTETPDTVQTKIPITPRDQIPCEGNPSSDIIAHPLSKHASESNNNDWQLPIYKYVLCFRWWIKGN